MGKKKSGDGASTSPKITDKPLELNAFLFSIIVMIAENFGSNLCHIGTLCKSTLSNSHEAELSAGAENLLVQQSR